MPILTDANGSSDGGNGKTERKTGTYRNRAAEKGRERYIYSDDYRHGDDDDDERKGNGEAR